ncbi:hypothetical protein Tco_0712287 [Tanacetum coccineum]
MTSVVGEQGINAVKPTAYWAWRPKIKMINHVYKNTGSCICKQFNYVDPTADSLLKTIWLSMHHVFANEHWPIPGKLQRGKMTSNRIYGGSFHKNYKSNDPPLSKGYTLGSGEDSLKLIELDDLYSNNVDEESQKIGRQAQVMISDAEEYLISEDPVKQGRMEETENA